MRDLYPLTADKVKGDLFDKVSLSSSHRPRFHIYLDTVSYDELRTSAHRSMYSGIPFPPDIDEFYGCPIFVVTGMNRHYHIFEVIANIAGGEG